MDTTDYFRDIASKFLKFRETGFLCDTILIADDRELKAHSVILAAVSPLFKSTFEASDGPGVHYIKLPGYDSTVVEIALNVIYTGVLVVPENFLDDHDLMALFSSLQNLELKLPILSNSELSDDTEADAEFMHQITDEQMTTAIPEFTEDGACQPSVRESRLNFERVVHPSFDDVKQICDDDSSPSDSQHLDVFVKEELEDDGQTEAEMLKQEDLCSEQAYFELSRETDDAVSRQELLDMISGAEVMGNIGFGTQSARDSSETAGRQRKLFDCVQCSKVFTHQKYLLIHSRIHTGEKPFVCTSCGRQFSQQANLNRHVLGHSGVKPHLCHVCGKSFIQKTQLDEHLQSLHDSMLRYDCGLCSLRFKDRTTLRQHFSQNHPDDATKLSCAVPSNQKSNICEMCGKSYASLGALRMHARVHTGNLFPCNKCHKAYVNRALLREHQRSHTKEKAYECETCGKAFIYKNALTVHTRVHTGEKPYRCTDCGNTYAQFGHLQSHKKTHTGEKPFTCTICSKSYRQKVDLRLHTKRVHSEAKQTKLEQGSISDKPMTPYCPS